MIKTEVRVCALTGHRDLPAEFDKNALRDKLEEVIGRGCRKFLCGMAMGFDLTALECLVSLKRRYDFEIEACIPYPGQETRFPPHEKKKYGELLAFCDRKSVLFENYREGCFFARDRFMVDKADLLVAYCTRRTGGSAYTVRYALSRGVPVERAQ